MTTKHRFINFISLIALMVNMLLPLGAPLVTAEDIVPPPEPEVTYNTEGEEETGAAQIVDGDADGVADEADNCPAVPNAGQEDIDGDGLGDPCDPLNDLDRDSDGIYNDVDNCPDLANDQTDVDLDGVGDACDPLIDNDFDGVANSADNCVSVANGDQTDLDRDGVGDACDGFVDRDGDGIADVADVCPDAAPVTDADFNGCEDPAPTATTAPVVVPTATTAPAVPTATTAPVVEPTATTAPVVEPTATTAPTVAPTPTVAPKKTDLNTASRAIQPMAALTNLTGSNFQGFDPVDGTWVESLGGNHLTCGSWIEFRVIGTSATGGNTYTFTNEFAKVSGGNGNAGYSTAEVVSVSGGTLVTSSVNSGGTSHQVTVTVETTGAGTVEVLYRAFMTCNGTPNANLHAGMITGGTDTVPVMFGNQINFAVLPTISVVQAQCVDGAVTAPSITWTGGTGIASVFTSPATYTDGQTVQVRVLLAAGYTLPSPITSGWIANTSTTDATWSAQYQVILTDVNCTGATIPDFTPNQAVCVNGAPGQSSFTWTVTPVGVTVSVAEGATSLGSTSPISLDGTVAHTLTVTLNLQSGYSWPTMTGWTVTGTTATRNFTVPAIDCSADVAVVKTGNGAVVAGQNAQFTIVVTNTSTTNDAVNVSLTDVLPAGYVWTLGGTNAASCTPLVGGTGTLSCSFGTLAPGATRTVTLTAPTNPHLCATISNTADVTAGNDTNATNNASSATITVTCTASEIPGISTAPFVCVDGITSGANTFTVNAGIGFTITSVQIDGVEVATGAGIYPLPAANGIYMLTVTATLNAGFTAPASPTADANGVYTFIQSVTVASCVPVGIGVPELIPSVCLLGLPTDPALTAPANVPGEVTYSAVTRIDNLDGTYTFTYTATVATGKTLPTTLPTSPHGSYAPDPAGSQSVARFTSNPIPLKTCTPTVSILKEVNEGSGTDGAFLTGDIITFTITVTNTGEGNATGVTFTDQLPAGLAGLTWTPTITGIGACDAITAGGLLSCSGIDLPALTGTFEVEFSAEVGATEPACGPYANTATLTGNYTGSSTANLTIECAPQVEASKTTVVATVTDDGAVITYTVIVVNTGNQALTGIDLNDELTGTADAEVVTWLTPAAFDGTIASLAIGATFTATASYTVSQADIDAGGPIVNCITVANDTTVDNDCATTTVEQDPGVAASKTTATTTVSDDGTVITYTIEVENMGNVTLTSVAVTDALTGTDAPADVILGAAVSSLGAGGFNEAPFTGTITTLQVGETVTITASYTVSQDDIDNGGPIVNCVGATTTGTSDPIPTAPGESDNCATTTVEQDPGVAASKTTATTTVSDDGTVITYTIEVENTGNVTLSDVIVTDALTGVAPAATVTFGAATSSLGAGGFNESPFTSPITTLQVGETVTITASYTVPQSTIDAGGPIVNCVGATTTDASDPIPTAPGQSDNCATTTVDQDESFTFTKVGPTAPVLPGEPMVFTITFTNTGNVTIANATITDPLPPLPAGLWSVMRDGNPTAFPHIVSNLAPGASVTLVATATVPAQIATPDTTWCKQWSNTAFVDGTFANEVVIDAEATATAQVNCTSLQITKTGSATVTPGGVVTYTIRVDNLGNTTVYGLAFEDNIDVRLGIPAGLNVGGTANSYACIVDPGLHELGCTSVTLEPGDFITVTGTFTLIAQPTAEQCDTDILNFATITNFNLGQTALRALGVITPPGTLLTSNTVTTDILCAPDVSFEKVGPAEVVQPGEDIVFNVTVRNDGSYPATDLMLTDNLPAALAGLTWGISTNDPAVTCERIGDSISCTNLDLGAYGDEFVLTLTAATSAEAPVCGTYTNYAGPSNGSRADLVSDTVTIACVPDYAIDKTSALTGDVAPVGEVSLGDTITYTINIQNDGNQVLTGLTLSDVFSGSGSLVWTAPVGFDGITIPDIAIGGELNLVATYVVTQDDVDAGTIRNCATVTLPGTQLSENDCVSDDIPRHPGIEIVKDGPATVNPGGTITYTLTVENTGNTFIILPIVTDVLPLGVVATNVVATGGMFCSLGGVVTCFGGFSLAPGQEISITITASVAATPNTAMCDAGFNNDAYVDGFTTAGSVSDTSNVVHTDLNCEPNVDLVKDGPAAPVVPGSPIEFTVTVTNTGTYPSDPITLTDTLPEGIADLPWVISPNTCAIAAGVITCDSFVLPAYTGEFVLTLTAATTAEEPVCGEYTNDASLTHDGTTLDEDAAVTIECMPDYAIDKTSEVTNDVAPVGEVSVGDTITYTINIQNDGNVVLTGLTLSDVFSGSGSLSWTAPVGFDGVAIPDIAVGDELDLVATYVVTQVDVDAGEVENCATVTLPETQLLENDCVVDDINQYPGIDIEKSSTVLMDTVAPTERVDAGDTIEYTFTVRNTGNVTLENVVVTDPLPGLTWVSDRNIGTMAPGDKVDLTATYLVLQEDIDAGVVENCALCVGDGPMELELVFAGMQLVGDDIPFVSDQDCVTTLLEHDPGIEIEKNATVKIDVVPPTDRVDAGDSIEYTIRVENTGNVTLTSVGVNDPLVGLSETIPSLAPGDWQEFTVTYVVTIADLNAGTVRNCADVVGDGPAVVEALAFAGMQIGEPYVSDEACVDTSLEKEPGIDIEKESSVLDNTAPFDRINAGDTIEYVFTVQNIGNVTLENVVVTDPNIDPTMWVDDPNIGSLTPGEMRVLTATYTITQADLDAGNVLNCADVVGNPPTLVIAEDRVSALITGDEPMPTSLFDEDCYTTDLEQDPGIAIVKTAAVLPGDDERVDAGDAIEYTFTVSNTGNVTLVDVVVSDPLPGLEWVSDTTIASLAPGATVELTATYAVTQAAIDAGTVENCATAAAETVSDEDCISTDIEREPGVDLEKTGTADTGDDDLLNVDEVITYTFAVTNTGNVTITDLTIDDPLEGLTWTDGNTIASLAPGETVELEATYIVTQADVDAGTIVNCAELTGTAADDSPVTDDDCDTQLIDQDPSLQVALVCPGPDGSFLPDVGDEITFEITISNDGDLTVTDIDVTTSRVGELDSPFSTSLEPGQSETRNFSIVVTQEDYDTRDITLEVDVVGTLPDGSVARLASMAMMQDLGATVEDTLSLQCPMGKLPKVEPTPMPTPAPKPPVSNLPNTGSGTAAASYATLWAATFTMIALGAGAIGIRRKHR